MTDTCPRMRRQIQERPNVIINPYVFTSGGALASDSFDRVNSVDIGSTDGAGCLHSLAGGSGLLWTQHNGTFAIASGRLVTTGAGPAFPYWAATIDAGQADCVVYATIRPVARYVGISARWDVTVNRGWATTIDVTTQTMTLYELQTGLTERASAAITASLNTDYNLKVTCSGQVITVRFNDTTEISYTSAAFQQTATRFGMWALRANEQFDNFCVHAG